MQAPLQSDHAGVVGELAVKSPYETSHTRDRQTAARQVMSEFTDNVDKPLPVMAWRQAPCPHLFYTNLGMESHIQDLLGLVVADAKGGGFGP